MKRIISKHIILWKFKHFYVILLIEGNSSLKWRTIALVGTSKRELP